jgi:hypothetical protein
MGEGPLPAASLRSRGGAARSFCASVGSARTSAEGAAATSLVAAGAFDLAVPVASWSSAVRRRRGGRGQAADVRFRLLESFLHGAGKGRGRGQGGRLVRSIPFQESPLRFALGRRRRRTRSRVAPASAKPASAGATVDGGAVPAAGA